MENPREMQDGNGMSESLLPATLSANTNENNTADNNGDKQKQNNSGKEYQAEAAEAFLKKSNLPDDLDRLLRKRHFRKAMRLGDDEIGYSAGGLSSKLGALSEAGLSEAGSFGLSDDVVAAAQHGIYEFRRGAAVGDLTRVIKILDAAKDRESRLTRPHETVERLRRAFWVKYNDSFTRATEKNPVNRLLIMNTFNGLSSDIAHLVNGGSKKGWRKVNVKDLDANQTDVFARFLENNGYDVAVENGVIKRAKHMDGRGDAHVFSEQDFYTLVTPADVSKKRNVFSVYADWIAAGVLAAMIPLAYGLTNHAIETSYQRALSRAEARAAEQKLEASMSKLAGLDAITEKRRTLEDKLFPEFRRELSERYLMAEYGDTKANVNEGAERLVDGFKAKVGKEGYAGLDKEIDFLIDSFIASQLALANERNAMENYVSGFNLEAEGIASRIKELAENKDYPAAPEDVDKEALALREGLDGLMKRANDANSRAESRGIRKYDFGAQLLAEGNGLNAAVSSRKDYVIERNDAHGALEGLSNGVAVFIDGEIGEEPLNGFDGAAKEILAAYDKLLGKKQWRDEFREEITKKKESAEKNIGARRSNLDRVVQADAAADSISADYNAEISKINEPVEIYRSWPKAEERYNEKKAGFGDVADRKVQDEIEKRFDRGIADAKKAMEQRVGEGIENELKALETKVNGLIGQATAEKVGEIDGILRDYERFANVFVSSRWSQGIEKNRAGSYASLHEWLAKVKTAENESVIARYEGLFGAVSELPGQMIPTNLALAVKAIESANYTIAAEAIQRLEKTYSQLDDPKYHQLFRFKDEQGKEWGFEDIRAEFNTQVEKDTAKCLELLGRVVKEGEELYADNFMTDDSGNVVVYTKTAISNPTFSKLKSWLLTGDEFNPPEASDVGDYAERYFRAQVKGQRLGGSRTADILGWMVLRYDALAGFKGGDVADVVERAKRLQSKLENVEDAIENRTITAQPGSSHRVKDCDYCGEKK